MGWQWVPLCGSLLFLLVHLEWVAAHVIPCGLVLVAMIIVILRYARRHSAKAAMHARIEAHLRLLHAELLKRNSNPSFHSARVVPLPLVPSKDTEYRSFTTRLPRQGGSEYKAPDPLTAVYNRPFGTQCIQPDPSGGGGILKLLTAGQDDADAENIRQGLEPSIATRQLLGGCTLQPRPPPRRTTVILKRDSSNLMQTLFDWDYGTELTLNATAGAGSRVGILDCPPSAALLSKRPPRLLLGPDTPAVLWVPPKFITDQIFNGIGSLIPFSLDPTGLGKGAWGWLVGNIMEKLYPPGPSPHQLIMEELKAIQKTLEELKAKIDNLEKKLSEKEVLDNYRLVNRDMNDHLLIIHSHWSRYTAFIDNPRETVDADVLEWRDSALKTSGGIESQLVWMYGTRGKGETVEGALYPSPSGGDPGWILAWTYVVETDIKQPAPAKDFPLIAYRQKRIAVRNPFTVSEVLLYPQWAIDAIWANYVRVMNGQRQAVVVAVEAAHALEQARKAKPDAPPPLALVLASQIAVEVEQQLRRQECEFLPAMPPAVGYPYMVQMVPNLVWAWFPPGVEVDTRLGGWRLPTRADVTFLLAQMGAPLPYDTTQEDVMEQNPFTERNIEWEVRPGLPRVSQLDLWRLSKMGVRPTGQFNWPRHWRFWPTVDVSSVWQQWTGFPAAGDGKTPEYKDLFFRVDQPSNPGVFYRSDYNWIHFEGPVVPPIPESREWDRIYVRPYLSKPRLDRKLPAGIAEGDIVSAEGEDPVWRIEKGTRRWFPSAKAFEAVAGRAAWSRVRKVPRATLAQVLVGAPLYNRTPRMG